MIKVDIGDIITLNGHQFEVKETQHIVREFVPDTKSLKVERIWEGDYCIDEPIEIWIPYDIIFQKSQEKVENE